MEPLEAVRSCGGAARTTRLLSLTARRGLDAAVATGELQKPARGVYAAPDVDPAHLAATVLGGVRSCHSAAAAWGLDLIEAPSRIHITCPPGTRGGWSGTKVHRRRVREIEGSTDTLTTVLDCLECLPRRFALVPVDHALRRGLVELDELQAAAQKLNRRDRRRALVAMADPKAESPLETVARVDLLDEGYSVETQEVIEPAGRVDFLIDGWLVVEVDGFTFHLGKERRDEDLRRDAELRAMGFEVLRFSWDQVVRQREWWLGVVREVHSARRARIQAMSSR